MSATHIVGRLWVGAKEDVVDWCEQHSGSVVALSSGAASALGPRHPCKIFSFADDDLGGMTQSERDTALAAADHVAALILAGSYVLVACNEGRNRAPLVAALAMVKIGAHTPENALLRLRDARGAHFNGRLLTNRHFRKLLLEDSSG